MFQLLIFLIVILHFLVYSEDIYQVYHCMYSKSPGISYGKTTQNQQ